MVTNSKFGGTSYANLSTGPIHQDGTSQNLTIKNSIIDGGATGGADTQATLIFAQGSGAITLQYNWFKNYPQQIIEILNSATLDYRYNLIDDGKVETGGHANMLQWSVGTASSPLVSFNTIRQTLANGAEGYQFYFNGTGTMNSPTVTYNTSVSLGTNVMTYMIHGSPGTGITSLTGTPVAHDNYFDPTGTLSGTSVGAFYPGSFSGWTLSNNFNMVTGAAISNNP